MRVQITPISMPNCFVNLPLDLINVILSQHSVSSLSAGIIISNIFIVIQSSIGRVLLRLDWEDQVNKTILL
jgi:hypothetical protein